VSKDLPKEENIWNDNRDKSFIFHMTPAQEKLFMSGSKKMEMKDNEPIKEPDFWLNL